MRASRPGWFRAPRARVRRARAARPASGEVCGRPVRTVICIRFQRGELDDRRIDRRRDTMGPSPMRRSCRQPGRLLTIAVLRVVRRRGHDAWWLLQPKRHPLCDRIPQQADAAATADRLGRARDQFEQRRRIGIVVPPDGHATDRCRPGEWQPDRRVDPAGRVDIETCLLRRGRHSLLSPDRAAVPFAERRHRHRPPVPGSRRSSRSVRMDSCFAPA